MKVFESLSVWSDFRHELKAHGVRLGFVPTMGALHAGHLSLIQKSTTECDSTLVSIFVNPTQFNNAEDFAKYPKTLSEDLELLAKAGVDYVLLPSSKEIYPDDYTYKVTENKMSQILCGAHRPGHFEGVLTIVMKLLGLAQAHTCYMGEKDYQQYLIIKNMAQSFFLDTQIVGCPTVREESGLALSSRNQRLSPAAREQAALIYKTLTSGTDLQTMRATLESSGFEIDYLEEHWGRRFVAAHLEGVRLIDNVQT